MSSAEVLAILRDPCSLRRIWVSRSWPFLLEELSWWENESSVFLGTSSFQILAGRVRSCSWSRATRSWQRSSERFRGWMGRWKLLEGRRNDATRNALLLGARVWKVACDDAHGIDSSRTRCRRVLRNAEALRKRRPISGDALRIITWSRCSFGSSTSREGASRGDDLIELERRITTRWNTSSSDLPLHRERFDGSGSAENQWNRLILSKRTKGMRGCDITRLWWSTSGGENREGYLFDLSNDELKTGALNQWSASHSR